MKNVKVLIGVIIAVTLAGLSFWLGMGYKTKQYDKNFNAATQPAVQFMDQIILGGSNADAALNSSSSLFKEGINKDKFKSTIAPLKDGKMISSKVYIGDVDNQVDFEVAGSDGKSYDVIVSTISESGKTVVSGFVATESTK